MEQFKFIGCDAHKKFSVFGIFRFDANLGAKVQATHERGVPFEEVLRERLAEHRAFWAGYDGAGTIADILQYGRRRHRTVIAQQEPI